MTTTTLEQNSNQITVTVDTIQLKRSRGSDVIPAALKFGEPFWNEADGFLLIGDDGPPDLLTKYYLDFSLARVFQSIVNKGAIPRTIESALLAGAIMLSTFVDPGWTTAAQSIGFGKAVDYCTKQKRALCIDSGLNFQFDRTLTSAGNLTVFAQTRHESTMSWTSNAADGGGWVHAINNLGYADRFTIMGVCLLTAGKNAGRALDVVGTSQSAQDRISTQLVVEDVIVRGTQGPRDTGWRAGIRASGLVNPTFRSVNVCGYLAGTTNIPSDGAGIEVSNAYGLSPHGAGAMAENCIVNHFKFGYLGSDFEMFTITSGAVQNCAYGVLFTGNDIYPQAHVVAVHFNCTFRCVLVQKMHEVQVIACTLYLQAINTQGTSARPAHVHYTDGAAFGNVSLNTFVVFDGISAADGVLLENCHHINVDANNFRCLNSDPGQNTSNPGTSRDATGNAIKFLSTALYNTVTDTNKYNDDLINTRIARDGDKNIFGGIFKRSSASPEGVGASYTHNDGWTTQEGEKVVTTDANGAGLILYVTPFSGQVVSRFAQNGDADNNQNLRIVPSVTLSNSVRMGFKVLNADGSAAANTPVRVVWRSSGYVI